MHSFIFDKMDINMIFLKKKLVKMMDNWAERRQRRIEEALANAPYSDLEFPPEVYERWDRDTEITMKKIEAGEVVYVSWREMKDYYLKHKEGVVSEALGQDKVIVVKSGEGIWYFLKCIYMDIVGKIFDFFGLYDNRLIQK